MKAKRVKVKNVKNVKNVKLDLHSGRVFSCCLTSYSMLEVIFYLLPVIAEEKLAAKGAQLLNEGQHLGYVTHNQRRNFYD